MSAKILIAGGTGLVGKALSSFLHERGYEISHLSRQNGMGEFQTYQWDPDKMVVDKKALDVDVIINLAGASVNRRWTKAGKKIILDSRVNSTSLLVNEMNRHQLPVKQLINASGINYYGMNTGDDIVDEQAPLGNGFLASVVDKWEGELKKLREQLGR